MIALVIVLLLPIYYIAKSKGYNAARVCVVAGLIGWLGPVVVQFSRTSEPTLPLSDITVPLIVLAVVWLLPARKGAPGKTYLKITFQCPECHQPIVFGREREGCAELCPKCGEIVTVPRDQFSPKPSSRSKTRPHASDGEVCFEDFIRQEDAIRLQTLLEANGIACRVVGNDAGGVMGQVCVWQDFKVVIDARDWDEAVRIHEGEQTAAPLPSEEAR